MWTWNSVFAILLEYFIPTSISEQTKFFLNYVWTIWNFCVLLFFCIFCAFTEMGSESASYVSSCCRCWRRVQIMMNFIYLFVYSSYYLVQVVESEREGDCSCYAQWILISYIKCFWEWLSSICEEWNMHAVSYWLWQWTTSNVCSSVILLWMLQFFCFFDNPIILICTCSFKNCELRSVVIIDRRWACFSGISGLHPNLLFCARNLHISLCTVWWDQILQQPTFLEKFLVDLISQVMLHRRSIQR